jgi:hypothetical protein
MPPRKYQQIADHGAHRAHLRTADAFGGLHQCGVLLLDLLVIQQLLNGDHGADAKPAAGLADAVQLLDAAQADDLLRRMDALLHQAEQIRAARQDVRLAPSRGELPERFLDGRG